MNTYLLGIEWSETNPKIACFRKRGSKYDLFKLDELSIEKQTEDNIVKAFSDWLKNNIPQNSQIKTFLALPESYIFLKETELPKINEKELDEAVFWETSLFTPLSPSNVVVQWRKIYETDKNLYVSVIAVKNDVVERLVSIFDQIGLPILAIEPTSLSLSRLLPTVSDKITLLASAGTDETNFIVIKNGSPIFSNSIPITLTGMKTKKEKLDEDIANSLANSVREVIYFLEQKKEGTVQEVVIAGDVVSYSGLASTINNYIHLPTIWGKFPAFNFLRPILGSKQTISRYLVALGAAIRPLIGSERVNLLPYKNRQLFEKDEQQNFLIKRINILSGLSLLILAVFLLLATGFALWNRSLGGQLDQARISINTHPAQKLINDIKVTNNLITQVGRLVTEQKDSGEKLQLFASLVPANIRLTSLTINMDKKDEWKIAGIGDRQTIIAFYQQLVDKSGARHVSMPYSNLQKDKDVDFKITIVW
ncbi:MAG: hypothetical protein V1858_03765 [Candidatus Gottesmanbacteria bacterium]